MSRPLDPEHTESLALAVRITRPLADALDAELARFTAANPGVSASRATIARIALMRVFLPTGGTLASASAPAHAPVEPPSVPVVVAHEATAASAAPRSESADAHESLRARYTDARERFGFKHEDAERALAAARLPVENLRRELAKPSVKWTPAHAAVLLAWLAKVEENGWPAAGERAAASDATVSAPAAAPKPAGVRVETTPENDELRPRYVAAVNAGSLTHRGTAGRVGCSDKMLRLWASGERRNLSAPLLSKIRRELKAHAPA